MNNDHWDYAYGEEDGSDEWLENEVDNDAAAWNHQMDLERQKQEEDWQSILNNDLGYHKWADDLDRLAEEDRAIMDLAAIEDERKFNTLQAWD